jgi:hypothetical protein
MHPLEVRTRARDLHRSGLRVSEVARQLNLPYRTVRDWCRLTLRSDEPVAGRRGCDRCADPPGLPELHSQYTYLLGPYIGDGHLVTRAKVPVLRIACAETYPALIAACEEAMLATLAKTVQLVPKPGCVMVQAYSKHWPCLFPQYGPGRKHQRQIVLSEWQQAMVDADPRPLLRGLFHSDGCRAVNRVTVRGKVYAYPRYFFANESRDILEICGSALDQVGVRWRRNRANSISVATVSRSWTRSSDRRADRVRQPNQ